MFSMFIIFLISSNFIVKYRFPTNIILYRLSSSSSKLSIFSIISSIDANSVIFISFSIYCLLSVCINYICISFFVTSPTIIPCSPNSSNPKLIGEPGYIILCFS